MSQHWHLAAPTALHHLTRCQAWMSRPSPLRPAYPSTGCCKHRRSPPTVGFTLQGLRKRKAFRRGLLTIATTRRTSSHTTLIDLKTSDTQNQPRYRPSGLPSPTSLSPFMPCPPKTASILHLSWDSARQSRICYTLGVSSRPRQTHWEIMQQRTLPARLCDACGHVFGCPSIIAALELLASGTRARSTNP